MLFDYLPLVVFFLMVVLFGLAMTVGNALLGPRRPTKAKGLPYECGIIPAETARRRFSVSFYLTAMLFIVFDVEAIFLYPWAVLVKHTLHVFGFIEMAIFVLLLGVALLYVWRKGALEWD
ncbi:MAG: NADH-quinone oxidoreductase subunit A [Candidatus Dormibacteria bacterium]